MVVRTTDPALTAAVATACRILGLLNNMQVEVTEERIDADPEMQPELEDLLTCLGDMWEPWGEFEGHPSNIVLDHLVSPFTLDSTAVWEPPTRPDRSFISLRLRDLVALPAELDLDCDVNMELLPEVQVIVPVNEVPQ